MIRPLMIGFATGLLLAAHSPAAMVTYTIDPNQSTLRVVAGTWISDANPTPQSSGSDFTTYSRTISAYRTASSIQFIGGSFIDAEPQSTEQVPGIGGNGGGAAADYGLRSKYALTTTFAAFRDFVYDFSGDAYNITTSGNFSRDFSITFVSGGVDWNAGAKWGHVEFAGRRAVNEIPSGSSPNLAVGNGTETLTVPLTLSTSLFSTMNPGDSNLKLSGTIVATRMFNSNSAQWTKDGGGSWNNPGNWDGGVPNSTGAPANFLGALTTPNSPAIITLDGDHTLGDLTFDNPNSYQITQGSGGTLTLDADKSLATLTVDSGRHMISAPLVLASSTVSHIPAASSLNIAGKFKIADNRSFTFTGAASSGVLTISGLQDHGAGAALNVNSGQLLLNTNAGSPGGGPAAPRAPLTIHLSTGDSRVILNSDQDLQSLAIDFLDSWNQDFDLNSPRTADAFRSVRIYDTSAGTKQNLYAAIISRLPGPGYGGIYDSGLFAHPSSALGIALIDDPRGWQYLLIRPTRIGDVNLDGVVSIADFIGLASNFGKSGADITWQEGDLNYDHSVTIADFINLAANFGSSYSGQSIPIALQDQQIVTNFATAHGVALAPDPGVLPLLSACLLAHLLRPRRQIQSQV